MAVFEATHHHLPTCAELSVTLLNSSFSSGIKNRPPNIDYIVIYPNFRLSRHIGVASCQLSPSADIPVAEPRSSLQAASSIFFLAHTTKKTPFHRRNALAARALAPYSKPRVKQCHLKPKHQMSQPRQPTGRSGVDYEHVLMSSPVRFLLRLGLCCLVGVLIRWCRGTLARWGGGCSLVMIGGIGIGGFWTGFWSGGGN
ncbi:hypothetical protein BDP55DRAFT_272625 [Colletotrichum godetiae]|uniref:Uncharacterized protein n=1 Tax=Colletotrichum godetiae TaxID=1209918 RepID=A0AAJ0ESB3_9PEZI|nr:uncharacterized protein BDP55DRAFT_272625 [Colletotrichum godetiae]KAK1672158.1 hypothetical protein BDP55DRAFT_272625 [Colletotrichum godetiae]